MPTFSPQEKPFLSSHPLLQDPSNCDLLYESSEQAEQLRRKLLKGANVLIVGGGDSHDVVHYDFMESIGLNVYIMDAPETLWSEQATSGHITGFIPCNIYETEGVEQRALEALHSSNIQEDFFDAVTSHHDETLYTSALVAKALNLHTNNPDAFFKAASKFRTRQALEQANISVPKYRKVSHISDIAEACSYVGFPVIVKPASGYHSIGVHRADSVEEAVNAFVLCDRTWTKERNMVEKFDEHIMVEEYLDGYEIDVDVILSDGKGVYAKVSDDWHQPPFFQDFGVHTPSVLDREKQEELESFAVTVLLAFGFENGVHHVECIYTKDGPHLIEDNARLGCGPVLRNHEVAWGVNLLEQHCFTMLRIPARPVIPERCLAFCVGLLPNVPFSGTVNKEGWLNFLHDDRMCAELVYYSKKGEAVLGPEEDVPKCVALVVLFSKESRQEVNAKALHVLGTMPVPITAKATNGRHHGFYVPPKDIFPFV